MAGRTHYMDGLAALQVGDEARAWEALFLCLCKTPDNRVAQRLVRQLESPPEEFFGRGYTEYQVRQGDTLSGIAKQAYGDPFLFYALARFNGIDNPSRLRPGQTLRVPPPRGGGEVKLSKPRPEAAKPSKAPAAPADRTPPEVAADPPGGRYHGEVRVTLQADDEGDAAPGVFYTLGASGGDETRYTSPIRIDATATLRFYAVDRSGNRSPVRSEQYELGSEGDLQSVRDMRDRGEFEAALAELEPLLAADSENSAARDLFLEVAVAHADALTRRDELLTAKEVLQRAETMAGGGDPIAARLASVEQSIEVDRLVSAATRAMNEGEYETAYEALNQALTLDNTHAVARGKLVVARSALIDRHSKEAMGAYRRQDLDESIRLWDRVLELDPQDETAQLRRAQAVHLQEQFQEKFQ